MCPHSGSSAISAHRAQPPRPGAALSATMPDLLVTADAVRGLHSGFLRSAQRFPDRPALRIDDQTQTYRQLRDHAAALAATIAGHFPAGAPELVGVLAHRSVTSFAGVLGALLSGRAYLSLCRLCPPEKTRTLLKRSGCRVLVIDGESVTHLSEALPADSEPLLLIFPDLSDVSGVAASFAGHRVLGRADLEAVESWRSARVNPDALAYLMYTSGSTGEPKGVMVTHRNVLAFLDAMTARYDITEHDRFTQMTSLAFDLSILDVFLCWEAGACLICAPKSEFLDTHRYIADNELTVYVATPSSSVFLKRMGGLKPGAYPALRWVLFCGEPLSVENARLWAAAAPSAVIENLYGPTELTVACTLYRYDQATTPAQAENGIVPIGAPFPGMKTLVVDEQVREVPPGEAGELLMTGPQLTLGYLNDPERTAASYVRPPSLTDLYYRTGDRVRRPRGDQPMTFLGRVDHQMKVRGIRIEPAEVEAVLREVAKAPEAVVLAWPIISGTATGIVAFLGIESADIDAIRQRVEKRLGTYIAPREYRLMPTLPKNGNGKIDRQALKAILEAGS
jgi:amino acid adenylation domain-containing protein